jgi:anti-sigma regulatory factor (Ser/Thr protein kinase)
VVAGPDGAGLARDILTEFACLASAEPGDLAEARVAVSELVANSLAHAPTATLTLWSEADHVVVEVRDEGTITDPMVGRRAPSPDAPGGRGLWTVHQLCRLTQVRSGPAGTTARVHLAARSAAA